jgi:hypothetical protein
MYIHKSQDINKKPCEELIVYFPFTVILVSDMTSRRKLECIFVMKLIKQYNVGGCSTTITDGADL